MSTAAAPSPAIVPGRQNIVSFSAKLLGFAAILAIAVAFLWKYAFRYYLHYDQAAFTDPVRGAANYWIMRGWLMMHITGATIAVLTGPWQFWTGFRARYARLHRWTGRIFLCGVAVGSVGSVRMAVGTTGGWATSAWELALAFAWVSTTAVAYYAILKGQVAIHKEWMARAYVVTFAFVTFRLLNDFGPTSRLMPESDRSITIGWVCWAPPLLVTVVVQQLRRMRRVSAAR